MKKKTKIILLLILFSSIIPLSSATANVITDNLFTGSSAYYVFELEQDDILIVNLTHTGAGNFSMYILDSRPITDVLPVDNIVSEGLNISYNATISQIYYLQIYLSDNGPDTFTLTITKNGENFELIRYYIPQIPGFPLEILMLIIMGAFGFILFFWKRKFKKTIL